MNLWKDAWGQGFTVQGQGWNPVLQYIWLCIVSIICVYIWPYRMCTLYGHSPIPVPQFVAQIFSAWACRVQCWSLSSETWNKCRLSDSNLAHKVTRTQCNPARTWIDLKGIKTIDPKRLPQTVYRKSNCHSSIRSIIAVISLKSRCHCKVHRNLIWCIMQSNSFCFCKNGWFDSFFVLKASGNIATHDRQDLSPTVDPSPKRKGCLKFKGSPPVIEHADCSENYYMFDKASISDDCFFQYKDSILLGFDSPFEESLWTNQYDENTRIWPMIYWARGEMETEISSTNKSHARCLVVFQDQQ